MGCNTEREFRWREIKILRFLPVSRVRLVTQPKSSFFLVIVRLVFSCSKSSNRSKMRLWNAYSEVRRCG